jgi:hypothetical protein
MSDPFQLIARAERTSIPASKTSLWCALRVDPTGNAMEAERAPLAVALVLDVSGSVHGDPILHVHRSCELVADLLGPADQLAIVTFSDRACVLAELTACDEDGRRALKKRLAGLAANGSTNVELGMRTAVSALEPAPADLRRAMVVLSDGQPNAGIRTAEGLAELAASLRPCGVSTLGFGLSHDESILGAIAKAGSGRYAYVPDPKLARVDLARAALAQGGIVADRLELTVRPAEGVELVRVLPPVALRHGGRGVRAEIGDVFVDEGRVLAFELAIEPNETTRGNLSELEITGRAPSGAEHVVRASLVVDVHAGPHAIDREAQRDVLLVRGDAARDEARAHADRGANAAAAEILRRIVDAIDASEGFVPNDGSPLAELREQLVDEIESYGKQHSAEERSHLAKGSMTFSPTTRATSLLDALPAPGFLVGLEGDVAGQRLRLLRDTSIGRSRDNALVVMNPSLSRRHARFLFLDGRFLVQDLGSTRGCAVNGKRIGSVAFELKHGDELELGEVRFRFERDDGATS